MANQKNVTVEPKFANLAMRDGSEWVYRIPDYLAGKVRIGSKVTVKYPTFEDDRFATVVDTLVSTHLRDDQLGAIVAVIDEEPYVDYLERRKQEKLLIQAAEQRKAEVERMAGYSAIADGDEEMKAILDALEDKGAEEPAQAKHLTDTDAIKYLDELIERIEGYKFGDPFEFPPRPGTE